ncbi:MAG: DUF1636 domain-containing protein [Thainema sp.]
MYAQTHLIHLPILPLFRRKRRTSPADGARLLEQLNTLTAEQSQSAHFEIQPVGCLWTCERPCAVAFSAPQKPTYLFTTLPTDTTAPALLEFGKLYLDNNTGDIPWKQFPEALQSVSICQGSGSRWMSEWVVDTR